MALIPPTFIDCVVAIGTKVNDETQWVGTGFLFGKFINEISEQENNYALFLVSNRHVFEGLEDMVIRFNSIEKGVGKDFNSPLFENGESLWVGHSDTSIDVAVTGIDATALEGFKFSYFRSNDQILLKQDLIDKGIIEGNPIFVLGYPMGLVKGSRAHVFLRGGAISRISDLYEGESQEFTIDSFIFPGNSGGPVLTRPEMFAIKETRAYRFCSLIGIVKSYIPYQDIAFSQQTNRPRVIFEENTGLTLVEPVDHILQTIEEFITKFGRSESIGNQNYQK